jgi:hypothetical protein
VSARPTPTILVRGSVSDAALLAAQQDRLRSLLLKQKGARREITSKTPCRTFLLPSALGSPPDRQSDQAMQAMSLPRAFFESEQCQAL